MTRSDKTEIIPHQYVHSRAQQTIPPSIRMREGKLRHMHRPKEQTTGTLDSSSSRRM